MITIIYYRPKPFPKCRWCRKEMEYWIPGLSDELHEHPECLGKHLANELINELRSSLSKIFDENKEVL